MTMTTEEREAVQWLDVQERMHAGIWPGPDTDQHLRVLLALVFRLTTPAPPATPAGDTDALVEEARKQATWMEQVTNDPDAMARSHSLVYEPPGVCVPLLRRLADALTRYEALAVQARQHEQTEYASPDLYRHAASHIVSALAARRGAQEGDHE
jgi:hypothetical protein